MFLKVQALGKKKTIILTFDSVLTERSLSRHLVLNKDHVAGSV